MCRPSGSSSIKNAGLGLVLFHNHIASCAIEHYFFGISWNSQSSLYTASQFLINF